VIDMAKNETFQAFQRVYRIQCHRQKDGDYNCILFTQEFKDIASVNHVRTIQVQKSKWSDIENDTVDFEFDEGRTVTIRDKISGKNLKVWNNEGDE